MQDFLHIFQIESSPALAFSVILFLGALSQWLAWRLNIAAILPLLLVGFTLGPWLGLLKPLEIGEAYLFSAVSLLVGLILFEGGLTLRLKEISGVGKVVFRLISLGALVTWLASASAAHFMIGLEWPLALLFGALIIVTGPTVIGPLIRNVRPKSSLANILKWEGILIDPVGTLIAALVLEFIILSYRGQGLGHMLSVFVAFIIVGTVLGLVGGYILSQLLSRGAIPHYLSNFMALAFVFGVFALSNSVVAESGLLATTVMGMLMANRNIPDIEKILGFKEDLTVFAISLLFIVLAANISVETLQAAFQLPYLSVVFVIIFVVRPLNIFVSSGGSSLTQNDKLFLSWIAPRGIVAAAVTSLFVSELNHEGIQGAEVILPLVFSVIVATVALVSLTANPVARFLGVKQKDPQGFLFLGAHPVARAMAQTLKSEGFRVLLSDTNYNNIALARHNGLESYYGSPLSDSSDDKLKLDEIGHLIALTSNDEANALTALKFAKDFSAERVFQLKPAQDNRLRLNLAANQRGRLVFYNGTTFNQLQDLFESHDLKKTNMTKTFSLKDFEQLYPEYLPLFVVKQGKVRVVSETKFEATEGSILISFVPKEA